MKYDIDVFAEMISVTSAVYVMHGSTSSMTNPLTFHLYDKHPKLLLSLYIG